MASASADAAPRRSRRVTRINKDASSPFDDLIHRVMQDKISQLMPRSDAHKYLSSRAFPPTGPSAAAAGSRSAERAGEGSAGEGGRSEEEGQSAGGGSAQEAGSSRKTCDTMHRDRDALAAWEDVVDINALD